MKERPIIFSTDMVKAILDGGKTQTRRVIKPQPKRIDDAFDGTWEWKEKEDYYDDLTLAYMLKENCPYGQVGDRLWVREAYWQDQSGGVWCYKAGGLGRGLENSLEPEFPPKNCGGKLVSPIFMPRWASRILLEITEIRVERLQEIENHPEDYKVEGYQPFIHTDAEGNKRELSSALIWFSGLWDKLNAKRGYGWEINPWVWCISFREAYIKAYHEIIKGGKR